MKTRSILGVWTLALAVAAIAILIIATSDHTDDKLALILLAVPIELAFVASGLVARAQRPHNRTGLLLIFVGFSWFFGALPSAGNEYVFTAGLLLGHVLHRAARTPAARLPDRRAERTRTDRAIAIAFYAVAAIGPPLVYVFDDGDLSNAALRRPVSGQRAVDCPEPDDRERDRGRVRLRRWRSRSPSSSASCGAGAARRPRCGVRSRPSSPTAGLLIAIVLVQNAVGSSPSAPPRW